MDLNLGPAPVHLVVQAPVLNDEGVGPQEPCPAHQSQGTGHLVVFDHHVGRHIHARASQVGTTASCGKGLVVKARCPSTRVKVMPQPQEHGVGTSGNGGIELLRTTCRSQKLELLRLCLHSYPPEQRLKRWGQAHPCGPPPASLPHIEKLSYTRRTNLRLPCWITVPATSADGSML